jgi:hypothetical protein
MLASGSYDSLASLFPEHPGRFTPVSRAFTVSCPKCGAAPGVPCDERASRDTPGNQFHMARIDFYAGRLVP